MNTDFRIQKFQKKFFFKNFFPIHYQKKIDFLSFSLRKTCQFLQIISFDPSPDCESSGNEFLFFSVDLSIFHKLRPLFLNFQFFLRNLKFQFHQIFRKIFFLHVISFLSFFVFFIFSRNNLSLSGSEFYWFFLCI